MRRRRPPAPSPDELVGEYLSCFDPAWQAVCAALPEDAVPLAWFAWPGRARWLARYRQWAAERTPGSRPVSDGPG